LSETDGAPIVYAEWLGAADRPTALLYGHYDVQPADPLSEWTTPPFQPEIRNGAIYGRGACDDKGQCFAHLKAIEAFLKTSGDLPVNIRVVIEGEEETGSEHLERWIATHREALATDVIVISDDAMPRPDQPAITYSMRGSVGCEISIRNAQGDLHSGHYGGVLHNPIQALCDVLCQLRARDGRIAVHGIYDDAPEPVPEERAYMARVGLADREILRNARAEAMAGEAGFSAYERATIRPALNITGIKGGYQGNGMKGIVPAQASAKIDLRLAPSQNARRAARLLNNRLRELAPEGLDVALRMLKISPPVRIDRRHPAMRAAARAFRRGFGHAPVFIRSGGTIPGARMFATILNATPLLMGFGLPDDSLHGPNEHFSLRQFLRGIATSIALWEELGRGVAPAPGLRKAAAS